MFSKVIIIGGGMAGLGAANKFNQLGFHDYIILEAQNECGGRIKTIEINGKPLDIGAQWLHGKQNPLYNIAEKHNLIAPEMSTEGEGKFIRNDGLIIDEFLVKKVDFQIGKILQECEKFIDHVEYPKSVGDFIRDRFDEYLKDCADSAETRQIKLELLEWHIRFQVIDNSCLNLDRLSAKNWGKYVCVDDVAHYNLTNGYKSLVDVLTNELPGNKIYLNTDVTKIEYDNKTNGQILLTCNDSQIFLCNHVILTASLGCLKDFTNIFPQLPKSITDSIDAIGFHGICKIYLIFDYKWWDTPAFQFIWKADTILNEEQKWLQCMTGFDEVYNQPSTLLGWVGGEAVQTVEQLSEEDVGRACMSLLRRFLPGYTIPEPAKVIRTQWFSNRWVKGSYCHITPECDSSSCGIHKLAEPVFVDAVPRILLAGEAVHPSHYSTTHGAFESGQQQASFLHDYIKTQITSTLAQDKL